MALVHLMSEIVPIFLVLMPGGRVAGSAGGGVLTALPLGLVMRRALSPTEPHCKDPNTKTGPRGLSSSSGHRAK